MPAKRRHQTATSFHCGAGEAPPPTRDTRMLRSWVSLKRPDFQNNGFLGRTDGGAEGDRTPDLRNAIATLSQLSYGPVRFSHQTAGLMGPGGGAL